MLIIYCIGLFDGCFGSGVWQCWNCRVPFFVEMERDARGRWHRSGQGLRRGILLGLRETAKSIAAGPELASGSDSRPCRNNAVSRSLSSNHPSSAAARPDATFLWLTLPADGKKPEYGTEANIKENIKETSKNPESRNQKPDRHSVPP